MNKKILLVICGILLISGLVWFWPKEKVVEGMIWVSGTTDVIGSRVGTSTTPGDFYTFKAASTTAITKITGSADTAIYTLKAVEASTTIAVVSLQFFGSNDYDCDTSTTTPNANAFAGQKTVFMKDINWYDIGTHVAELAGSKTLPASTSTIQWTPQNKMTSDITLTNLNYECLKVELNASSTRLLMQVKTKGF